MSHRVQIIGTHYIAFGDYSDVWEARLDEEPGKVLVTGSSMHVDYHNGATYTSWFR